MQKIKPSLASEDFGCQTSVITSNMSENGVVFSDGIIEDTIDFNAGMQIRVGVSDRIGKLVIG